MKRKLGMNCDCIRHGDLTKVETLELISQAGFECVFMNMNEPSVIGEVKKCADRLGLEFQFIHAPYKGSNRMWLEGDDYLPLQNGILESVDVAAENGIGMIVMHVTGGWHTPPLCDLGFSRYDKIVEYAGKKGIRIAFENVRKLGDHACMMQRYEDLSHVGFCYDTGHEHCYTETVPFIDLYHKRMWCTHLNDNLGRDHKDLEADGDFHYLPLDGTFDFQNMIRKMDHYGYNGSLMLEVFNTTRPEYKALSPEEYIRLAYRKLKSVSEL